ncbi:Redoxin [Acaromyces ingoldii]|uniref:Redoxin n=1 Tax=Acaromyces ingoldii TaxID=215250 RepID=A0A316YX39_9BASI|nr:Redoxin [Acaromyces ingoldii]PWN93228.1 Redoxin [Acaromyces ingoldii]
MECEWSPALEDPKACPMPPKQFTAESAWKGKTTVIVSVPGAYTPTCHGNHAPGFVSKAKEFTEKGAQVYIVSYNDPFVMSGWRSALGAKDEVHFATEFDLGLSKFLDATVDMSKMGFGTRGARYALVVDPDLKIKSFDKEASPGEVDSSHVDAVLGKL